MKKLILLSLLLLSVNVFSQIKVACVGNSITYGSGIKDRTKTYPAQLDSILGNDWDVENFGVSGSTMLKVSNKPYWEMPEFDSAQNFNPDVVIIMLGTNDSKDFNWDCGHKNYIKDYFDMIDIFRNLPSKPIIYLCLPIPVVENRWKIDKETVEGEITEMVKKVSKKKNTELIDLYSVLEGHYDLIPDKIHPNGEGALLMAKHIYQVLLDDKNMINSRFSK